MFKRTKPKIAALSTAIALISSIGSMPQAHASNQSDQSTVDEVKTSKDDNQHQVNATKNSYKKGTPLPFEGPPAKSKGSDEKRSKKTSTDEKP